MAFENKSINKNIIEITLEVPVNETSGMRLSSAIAWPIGAPPQKEVKIAPGKLLFFKTPATNFVIAMVTKGVVREPFLRFIAWKELVMFEYEYALRYAQKSKMGLYNMAAMAYYGLMYQGRTQKEASQGWPLSL